MFKTIGKNLGVLLFLGIIVYAVTIYWDSIVKYLPSSATGVLGANVAAGKKTVSQKQQEVEKNVEDIVKDQTNLIKQQVLHITVGDILQTMGRAQKIAKDAKNTGQYVSDQIGSVTNSLTKSKKK